MLHQDAAIRVIEVQAQAALAHERLDILGSLHLLQGCFDYSLRDIDKMTLRYTGQRATPAATSKFTNKQPGAPRSLPGVAEVSIHVMASTPTGIARRALLAEHALRQASATYYRARQAVRMAELKEQLSTKLTRQLKVAKEAFDALLAKTMAEVANERSLIMELAPAAADDTTRALDLSSVDYLEGQDHIHAARLLPSAERAKRLRLETGLCLMLAVCDRLNHALSAGSRAAEPIDLILAVNALLNAYFVSYELDDLEGTVTFGRARDIADKIVSPLFLLAADTCAKWQGDPRMAFNVASAAGLANQHQAAAKRLKLAAEIDGFSGVDILGWHADWMLEPLSATAELADAITILRTQK